MSCFNRYRTRLSTRLHAAALLLLRGRRTVLRNVQGVTRTLLLLLQLVLLSHQGHAARDSPGSCLLLSSKQYETISSGSAAVNLQ